MGSCGSKDSPVVVEEAPKRSQPNSVPSRILEETNIVESNIVEPEDEELSPEEAIPNSDEGVQQGLKEMNDDKSQSSVQQHRSMDDSDTKTTTTSRTERVDNHNPIPKDVKAEDDKPSNCMATSLSSKLEVPIQNPRNTQKISVLDFFNDDEVKSIDFDQFDSASINRRQDSFVGSVEIIDLKDEDEEDTSNSKVRPSLASYQTASTSSYEEIIIESDNEEYETESAQMETRSSSGSYEEEVIDDEVYDAFVRAQEESHGALTFDDFLHRQQSGEIKCSDTASLLDGAVAATKEPVLELVRSGEGDEANDVPVLDSISTNGVDKSQGQGPSPLVPVEKEKEVTETVEVVKTTLIPNSTDAPELLMPFSPQIRSNGDFLGMELHVIHDEGPIIDPDGFLVSPVPSHSRDRLEISANDLISPLTVKGFDVDVDVNGIGKGTGKGRSDKRSKKGDRKKSSSRSKSKQDDKEKKSDRKSSRKRKSTGSGDNDEEDDDRKEHRKHHRRKDQVKSSHEMTTTTSDRNDKSDKSSKSTKTKSRSKSVDDNEKRSSSSNNNKKSSDKKKHSSKRRDEDLTITKQKSEVASSGSMESSKSTGNPILLTKSSNGTSPTSVGNVSSPIRRSPRKIKFQPRASLRATTDSEEAVPMSDHTSIVSDRSDFVKKMDALRARLDEAVGSASDVVPSSSSTSKDKSKQGEEKPRSKHKIRRKVEPSSSSGETTERKGTRGDRSKRKEKGQHRSSSSRTTSSSRSTKD